MKRFGKVRGAGTDMAATASRNLEISGTDHFSSAQRGPFGIPLAGGSWQWVLGCLCSWRKGAQTWAVGSAGVRSENSEACSRADESENGTAASEDSLQSLKKQCRIPMPSREKDDVYPHF